MPLTPQQVWDAYRADPEHDMFEYSPILRKAAHGNILEIGVRGGVSTSAFLLGVEANGGRVYSVDVTGNCKKLFEHSQWLFIHANSQDTSLVKACLPDALDVLLVDGGHSFRCCRNDLFNYGPLVRSGGKIFVHDVTPRERRPEECPDDWPTDGPIRAFNQFIVEQGERIKSSRIIPGQFGMGLIEVA